MSFDICLSFDKAKYLDSEIYLFVNAIKDNLPKETVIHIVTNRDSSDDAIKYMKENLNTKIYYNDGDKTKHLISRCRYMLNCFDIESDKEWIVKMELDMLAIKHLNALNDLIENNKEYDLLLEPENRKIFDDKTAHRLWRIIYKSMGMKYPKDILIEFRENKEKGLPLFGTGMIIAKKDVIDYINANWIKLTKICEKWIHYNIHPNEFAFTALVINSNLKWKLYDDIYKFNPIGHFRDGEFPSTKLKDNCILPDNVIIFDYHRPEWLLHVAKFNPELMNIIGKTKNKISEDWWNQSLNQFQEISKR